MDDRPSITVRLDGRALPLPAGSSLAELVARLGHAADGVTTAVDGRFVPRAQRPHETLQDGQTVLLFQPIVGG